MNISRKEKQYPPRDTIAAIAAVFLATLTLYGFAPATIYSGNINEFQFGYLDFLAIYAFPFVITLGIGLMAVYALSPKGKIRFGCTLFILSVLFWFQGNFLVRDYGLLDGNLIDWSKYTSYQWIDIIVWFVGFLLGMYFWSGLRSVLIPACWLLVTVQLSYVGLASLSHGTSFWLKESPAAKTAPAGIYEYSSSLNVVHILLDHFQTDVFLEIVKEEGWGDQFDGFVVYRENIGTPLTSFSIPTMFSGRVYDGSEALEEFYRRSIRDEGFPNVLYEQGYTVTVIPQLEFPSEKYTNLYRIPTIYGGTVREEKIHEASYLMDVALFRGLPQPIKRFVYNDSNWRMSGAFSKPPSVQSLSDLSFFKDYTERIRLQLSDAAYHFLHLYPPHPPYVMSKDGSYAGVLPPSRENYKIQAMHTLRAFIDYLRRLKALNLYDRSLIVLQSDHGAEFPPVVDGKVVNIGVERVPALLALKMPKARGSIKMSDAQTAISDVPATILNVLGLEWPRGGESILELDPAENRERYFVSAQPTGGGVRGYTVTGSIYNKASWRRVESKITGESEAVAAYQWGSSINFGLLGNAAAYKRDGWSIPQDGFEWTNGHRASLEIPIKPPRGDIRLSMRFLPFLPPGHIERQRVNIYVDDVRVDEWIIDRSGLQKRLTTIPQESVSRSKLNITFELPDARSPRDLGISPDRRALGLAVGSIVMDIRSTYEWGSVINFGLSGNAGAYKKDGWSSPEDGFEWTHGHRTSLEIPIKKPPRGDIRLSMRFLPFLLPGRVERQRVYVFVDDVRIGEWIADERGAQTRSTTIPRKLISRSMLNIAFELPDAASPRDLGLSPDARILSMAVQSVFMEEDI